MHLLERRAGRLRGSLSAKNKRGSKIFRLGSIHSGNRYAHAEFTFRFAAMHAPRWGNIGVIPPHSDADVAFPPEKVIGGIEFHPAGFPKISFDPGVRRARGGAVVPLVLMIKVAADVAARNAELAHESDHDVSKILADTLASAQGIVNGRIHTSSIGHVAEGFVE